MRLFVLDTDILTLFDRGDPTVVKRVLEHSPADIAISVITVEEQLSGWYSQIRKAKSPQRLAWAYRNLAANIRFLRELQILDYGEPEIQRYENLRRLRLKVRKMDLQIAVTALERGAAVVTRNVRDFNAVPGLNVEDWSK